MKATQPMHIGTDPVWWEVSVSCVHVVVGDWVSRDEPVAEVTSGCGGVVDVGAPTAGFVTDVRVQEGDLLRQGEPLFCVQPSAERPRLGWYAERATTHADAATRLRALRQLVSSEWQTDRRVLQVLTASVRDEDTQVGLSAMGALLEFWKREPETLRCLQEQVLDPTSDVSEQAFAAIVKGWSSHVQTLPWLQHLVETGSDSTARRALEVLRRDWRKQPLILSWLTAQASANPAANRRTLLLETTQRYPWKRTLQVRQLLERSRELDASPAVRERAATFLQSLQRSEGAVAIVVPALGEEFGCPEIAHWLVKAGSRVVQGEDLVELGLEKATVTIPSPATGVILELDVEPGDSVDVGGVIAMVAVGLPSQAGPANGD